MTPPRRPGPLVHLANSLALFAVAFAIRWWFFCGFILGDDGQEYSVVRTVLDHGPLLTDQLHLRFGWWLLTLLSFRFLGISETTFILPQWVTSSTLPMLAYGLLISWGYGSLGALLGGLFVATAPFEVLVGTTRVNDLYLAWAIAVGLLLLVRLQDRPARQGAALAACLWFGFYVKLWAVYALPALACYYLPAIRRGPRRRSLVAFVATSLALHALTCIYWKIRLDTFFPFVHTHAANYPIPPGQLTWLLSLYPKMIFLGSEFGTTLFGAVPYMVLALLLVKAVASLLPRRLASPLRFDRADGILVVVYGSLFLLINYFPNGFSLTQYYSVPRIFRYVTPISFPMTLHVAKMLLDLSRIPARALGGALAAAVIMLPCLGVNLVQANEATLPGHSFRSAFLDIVRRVKADKPPKLVADHVIASWLRDLYLYPSLDRRQYETDVVILYGTYSTQEYETWVRTHEAELPEGTMLITGLAGFLHYCSHNDSLRLAYFSAPLGPRWRLVGEYALLSYLPRPEPARLWRLTGPPPGADREAPAGPPAPPAEGPAERPVS